MAHDLFIVCFFVYLSLFYWSIWQFWLISCTLFGKKGGNRTVLSRLNTRITHYTAMYYFSFPSPVAALINFHKIIILRTCRVFVCQRPEIWRTIESKQPNQMLQINSCTRFLYCFWFGERTNIQFPHGIQKSEKCEAKTI